MHRLLARRPSPAMIVALISLFVALGGTSYAVTKVGTKQLKNRAVTSAKLRNGAVTTSKLRDGAVTNPKLGDGSVTTGKLVSGAVTTGQLGDNAVTGAKVANGSLAGGDVASGTFLGGRVTVQHEVAAADLAVGAETSIDVHCPAGQTALGGGARGDDTESEDTNVGSSRPIISTTNGGAPVDGGTFTGWRASVQNEEGPATGVRPEVWVICAAIP